MIAVDASVVIALLDRTDALHERAIALVRTHIDEPLVLHALTRAEVMVGPLRRGLGSQARGQLDALGVQTLGLDGENADRLAALRVDTGLRLPDCCVLLAAEELRGAVASFDRRLVQAARHRQLVVVPG